MTTSETSERIEKTADSKPGSASAGSQVYLGTPAGIMLCVDEPGGSGPDAFIGFEASLWHAYSAESLHVRSPEQMLRKMEGLFDLINFPRPTTTLRTFSEDGDGHAHTGRPGNPANVPRYLSDQELLEKRGKAATFIIRVQLRQNSDWQGRITWVEKDKTLRFRTIMEMLKLIEAALEGSKR